MLVPIAHPDLRRGPPHLAQRPNHHLGEQEVAQGQDQQGISAHQAQQQPARAPQNYVHGRGRIQYRAGCTHNPPLDLDARIRQQLRVAPLPSELR